MAYKDGEIFTTYCDKLYDRHHYRINFSDGRYVVIEDYQTAKYFWYENRKDVVNIEIIDTKVRRSPKGF